MRAAKGGTMGRVRGREGGAVLEGGETYASAGGHGDGSALCYNGWIEGWLERLLYRAENPLRLGIA